MFCTHIMHNMQPWSCNIKEDVPLSMHREWLFNVFV